MVFYEMLPVELWLIIYKIEHQQKYRGIVDNINKDREYLNRANELIIASAMEDGFMPTFDCDNESDLWTYIEHKIFVEAIAEGFGQQAADTYLSEPNSYIFPL